MEAVLRDEPGPSPDDRLYVHMGAGQVRDEFIQAMVVRYDLYRGVHPNRLGRGALAVSTYAEVRGVTRADIIAAMRHNQYGVAHRSGLPAIVTDIWPTTVLGTSVPERIMAVHYDLILDDEGLGPLGPIRWALERRAGPCYGHHPPAGQRRARRVRAANRQAHRQAGGGGGTMRGMDKEEVDVSGRVPEIFVDFSLVGLATRFRTWMPVDQRRALTDGQEIKVYGDAVDPIRARVVHVDQDDPEVEVELINAA
jgi:hypothetical protein